MLVLHIHVFRSVKDQVQRSGTCGAPSLPEHQPMSLEKEQLLDQMAKLIIVIGDSLDREKKFNELVSKVFFFFLYEHIIVCINYGSQIKIY